MKKPLEVRLIDDMPVLAEGWETRIKRVVRGHALNIQVVDAQDTLPRWMDVLTELQNAARRGRSVSTSGLKELDRTDILIVDYDLLGDSSKVSYTGEDVAYLVRCFSGCGLIVAVNQGSTENYFDLTLSGKPGSWADLNISDPQLDNDGLWNSPWEAKFRPWHWPVLPDLVARHRQRVEFVHAHLNAPMLPALGFNPTLVDALPRATVDNVCGKLRDTGSMTFSDFVSKSGNALRPKDTLGTTAEGQARVARVAAARASRWLEDYVLAGQEVLVDAPHLVARYPGLLGREIGKVAAWNKAAQILPVGADVKKVGVWSRSLDAAAFQPSFWLSRPAWFWHKLAGLADIRDLRSSVAHSRSEGGLVFCEDVSAFVPRARARQFVSSVHSSYLRRYVAGVGYHAVDDVVYSPASRFAA